MKSTFKILLITLAAFSLALNAEATEGNKKKAKAKVKLAVTTGVSLRTTLLLDLKTKSVFKTTFLKSTAANNRQTNVVTFKKGNNTYILPYKQKIIVNESGKGYSGFKLQLRIPR